MGYDDDTERSRQRRSRARQPVKRMGSREVNQRRSREPGYTEPGLNLITDTFPDGGRRRRPSPELEAHRGRREDEACRSKAEKRAERKAEKKAEKKAERYGGRRAPQEPMQGTGKRKAKKRRWKIRVILFEVLILLSVLVFAGYTYVNGRLLQMQRLPWDPEEIKNVDISEEKQEQMKGYWTVAVFGVDSRDSSVGKGNNSDVNMICNINQDTGEIKLVSVYRDAYLNVNDKNSYNKINSAYLQGGPEQAVKALNKNLDLDIDDYITFNWKSVAQAINIVGGIDLEISKAEFYYINAFISETVQATGIGSYHLKHAGMNHLDGVQAVAYGRLRLMDTDYARTERQRKVIKLAFEKVKTADWATINALIQTVFVEQVSTSVELNDVLAAGRNITKYHLTETMGFPAARGEANMGNKGACVIPQTLESNVTELHRFLFGDENYEPTETVKAISRKIISDTGLAKEKQPAGDVGTGGGYVPKATAGADKSLEESTADGGGSPDSERSADADGESRETDENGLFDPHYPGSTEEPETDSNGNLIFPSGSYNSEPGSRPSTERGTDSPYGNTTSPYGSTASPYGSTDSPYGSTDSPYGSTASPYGSTASPYGNTTSPYGSTENYNEMSPRPSGTTESVVPRPGTGGSGTSGGNNSSGGDSPYGGGNNPAGSSTDTGVIIAPGNSAVNGNSRGNSSGNVEFSGPPGN